MRAVMAAMLWVVWLPSAVAAQTTAVVQQPGTERRWSVSGAWVMPLQLARLEGQFGDALRKGGFDALVYLDWTGPRMGESLRTSSGMFFEGEVVYRHNSRLAVGLLRSPSQLVWASGSRSSVQWLHLSSHATLVAPIAYVRLGKGLRIGAGPLAAWTRIANDGIDEATEYTSVVGGALIAGTLEARTSRTIFLAVNASYRWIAPVDAGPFTTTFMGESAGIPSMRVNLSHASLAASLGFRF